MIGFHLQGNVDNWPQAVAKLPAGAPFKTVDNVQRCVEAKAVNPGIITVVRHHVSEQNPNGDKHQIARQFFASFVDGTFRTIAHAVDYIQEWNEYFSNSQSTAEKQIWIDWATAAVEVWRDEYRTQPEYAHIGLILAETAVGNDIPIELAALSSRYDWVALGYHPYVPVYQDDIRPDDWQYYSGRWAQMDSRYLAAGYRVKWFFGEFGAVGHNGPGWPNSLAPNDGWQDDDVYDGNIDLYLDMMRYWMNETENTAAWKQGRIIGATIFTSGGGSQWGKFEVKQPEMDTIADMVRNYTPAAVNPFTGLELGYLFQVPYALTSLFDSVRDYGKHEGADYDVIGLVADSKEQVRCVYAGTVSSVATTSGYGNRVIVRCIYNGNTFYTWYAHLDGFAVTLGQSVEVGDAIGEIGATGNATGEHVHFNLQLPEWGLSGYVVPNVVDPEPYFVNHPHQLQAIITPPVETIERGAPRAQYKRTVFVAPQDATLDEWIDICSDAYPQRNTVGFSYDDAGIGDLDNRTAILYGIADGEQAEYAAWFERYYPGVAVEFR